MVATIPGGEYGIGKTLARARAGGASGLDWLRLRAWRNLVEDGADAFAAFVSVATHAELGFRSWRGRESVPPAAAARKFRAFAERMALPEWERARAEAALTLAASLPQVARRIGQLATAETIADPDAARVNVAAGRIVLEAAGLIGGRASTTINVAQRVALAQPDEAAHNLAARIASNPAAAAAQATLLGILDPPEG